MVDYLTDHRSVVPNEAIECIRARVLHDNQTVSIVDYGAGIKGGEQAQTRHVKKRLSSIMKNSATPPLQGALLSQWVKRAKPAKILELGTSLGIGTMYLAAGDPGTKVYTMEGAPAIADIARQHFIELGFSPQILQFVGSFDALLKEVQSGLGELDMVFLDGHHAYAPTIDYFERLLPSMAPGAILIVDDIRWTQEMWRAWRTLQRHPKVKQSMDYWHLGVLRLRTPDEVAHPARPSLTIWPRPRRRWLMRK